MGNMGKNVLVSNYFRIIFLRLSNLYSTCRMVSRKLEINEKFATSLEEGGFSGTSGRQNPNQVCISASENGPVSRNVLHGLRMKQMKSFVYQE